jgi:DHA3 family tetracycline resistance protein-like MFS transporter
MRLRPSGVYALLCGAQGFAFGLGATMNAVFKIEDLRLGPLQLVLLGTIMESAIFLCEIPTGVVADVVSRRLSVLIGLGLLGVGWLATGLAGSFAMIAAAALVIGVAETFVSGAREAWIADEMAIIEPEASVDQAFARGSEAGMLARFFGSWTAAGLAIAGSNATPIIATGAVFLVICAGAALLMTEHGFERKHGGHSLRGLFAVFGTGYRLTRSSRVLTAVLAATLAFGAASEGFDRLWQNVLIAEFSPLPPFFGLDSKLWWAALNTGALVTGALLVRAIRRRGGMESDESVKAVLRWITGGLVIGLIAFAAAPTFWWGIGIFIFVRTLRRASDPLFTAWLNRNAQPEVRATLLSFQGQAHSLGELGGGPLLGAIGSASLRLSMAVSGLLIGPALLFMRRAAQR